MHAVLQFHLLASYLQLRHLFGEAVQPILELWQHADLKVLLQQPQFTKLLLQRSVALPLIFIPVRTAGHAGTLLRVL